MDNLLELKKREMAALLEPDMRKIKSLVHDSESMRLKYKDEEEKLKRNLLDIRRGSDDGAMDQLCKKMKLVNNS